jgi:hypothetical protein
MILILQVLVKVLTKGEKDLGSFLLPRSHFSLNEIKFNLTQFTVSSTFISFLQFGKRNLPQNKIQYTTS